MLVENFYPQDTRVRNEATLLVGAGYQVSVIAWRKPGQAFTEEINGVRAYRVRPCELFDKTPSRNDGPLGMFWLKAKSLLGYMAEYGVFTASCLALTFYVLMKEGFDVLHAHNPPDTLFLVAIPYKLLGKKFVFDHHDLCPELYQSRFGAKAGFYSGLLRFFEARSLSLANVTIATNESYKQIQIERGGRDPKTVFVVRNGPDASRMTPPAPSARLRGMNKTILCYIGALNPQDGVDYLLRSIRYLYYDLKRTDFYCVVMGGGDSLANLRTLAKELQLEDCLELTGFVSEEDLRSNLAAADICVDPDPSSPLNDVSTWIKIMEYMAFSKPIVTFDLKETHFSAREAALYVPPNDEKAFAAGIAKLMDDPALRRKMGEFGRGRVEKELQWKIVSTNLLEAYQQLSPQNGPQLPQKQPALSSRQG
jgi:glycosyltransferase involved in cell wall biosynthesis